MTDRSKVKTVTQVKANQPCENKRQALSQIKRIDWSLNQEISDDILKAVEQYNV